ncbi:MAG TPA: hypothetical protein PK142_02945 [bacterium]|nr:hypothetical protein [bacterium]
MLWLCYKVKYKFDFFCLYNNELLNEKVEGSTKYEYHDSHSNKAINKVELNRSDEDIRIIIDSLFEYLKGR